MSVPEQQPADSWSAQKNVSKDAVPTAELIKLIGGLNDSVKQLAQRFDKFQGSIEAKVNKMHGEIVILKNKVQVLESNVKP